MLINSTFLDFLMNLVRLSFKFVLLFEEIKLIFLKTSITFMILPFQFLDDLITPIQLLPECLIPPTRLPGPINLFLHPLVLRCHNLQLAFQIHHFFLYHRWLKIHQYFIHVQSINCNRIKWVHYSFLWSRWI